MDLNTHHQLRGSNGFIFQYTGIFNLQGNFICQFHLPDSLMDVSLNHHPYYRNGQSPHHSKSIVSSLHLLVVGPQRQRINAILEQFHICILDAKLPVNQSGSWNHLIKSL